MDGGSTAPRQTAVQKDVTVSAWRTSATLDPQIYTSVTEGIIELSNRYPVDRAGGDVSEKGIAWHVNGARSRSATSIRRGRAFRRSLGLALLQPRPKASTRCPASELARITNEPFVGALIEISRAPLVIAESRASSDSHEITKYPYAACSDLQPIVDLE